MTKRAIRAEDAHKYLGRWVSGTFNAGWGDYFDIRGKLISVDEDLYVEVCDCEDEPHDCVVGSHGACRFSADDTLYVHVGGKR